MTDVGQFRGAGGAVFDLALPLSDSYQHQVDRGELKRIDLEEDADAAPKRPPNGASKKDWVGYVVKAGLMKVDDADALTRNDLAEKFGE